MQVLSVSSELAQTSEAAGVSVAIRESLLAAIDNAFADVVTANWATRANSTGQFKIFRDIQAALSCDDVRPIYSRELARQVGVFRAHDARRRATIPRDEPSPVFAPQAIVVGASAAPGRSAQRQGLRARRWLLAPQRFLPKLSFAVRGIALGNAREGAAGVILKTRSRLCNHMSEPPLNAHLQTCRSAY